MGSRLHDVLKVMFYAPSECLCTLYVTMFVTLVPLYVVSRRSEHS